MAGTVIVGVLIASPAVAHSSIPADKPVPPNTSASNVAKTPAKGLGEHEKKKQQKIVRAVVNSEGNLVKRQSFGAASATRVGTSTGTYQVCFDVPVNKGTYVASIGLPGNVGTSAPGEITVVGRIGTDNCLFIQTYNSEGVLADRGFHVTVAYSQERRR
ncbi:hypothetical protein [Streptomyces abyssalis]|uniref:hypothetical protein n=1 Tax=Streptomyces abyssalis TaxID=933944 RepID=UPI00085BE37F|nr:hypothetical protein [Streptomyces abyssalis]